jgi:DNA-binding transcriptional ArsR family regulator
MTDEEAVKLLRLLHQYVMEYRDVLLRHMTVSELAEDLAMSMDTTTDEADKLRREIEEAISA